MSATLDLSGVHPTIRAFKEAVEADDLEAAKDLLHPDCDFTSPVVYKPYRGGEMTRLLLTAAGEVFAGTLRYERVLSDERGAALVFRATVDGREVHGTDFITLDDDGRIVEFMVMLRPMSGLHAMAEAMAKKVAEFEGA